MEEEKEEGYSKRIMIEKLLQRIPHVKILNKPNLVRN